MSWSLDSVPVAKVWKIYTNVASGKAVTTAGLTAKADTFFANWLKSFPELNNYTYLILAGRKGSAETFIYFECKEGIHFTNFQRTMSDPNRFPWLLKVTHDEAPSAAISMDYNNNYGIYCGLTVTGSPITADQTYATVEEMKVALEGLGYTTYLNKNTGVVSVPSGIVVNTNLSRPLRYSSIESASQLINAVLNKQSLAEIVAIDKTGLAMTYYDTIYMLSYIVQQRNFPKFVT